MYFVVIIIITALIFANRVYSHIRDREFGYFSNVANAQYGTRLGDENDGWLNIRKSTILESGNEVEIIDQIKVGYPLNKMTLVNARFAPPISISGWYRVRTVINKNNQLIFRSDELIGILYSISKIRRLLREIEA